MGNVGQSGASDETETEIMSHTTTLMDQVTDLLIIAVVLVGAVGASAALVFLFSGRQR